MEKRTALLSCFLLVFATMYGVSSKLEFKKPRLVTSLSRGSPVYGVASVNGSLHVIREGSSSVQVYSLNGNGVATPSKPLDSLTRSGYYDMVALAGSDHLALLNWFDSKQVFLLQLQTPQVLSNFTILSTGQGGVASLSADRMGGARGDDVIVVTESAERTVRSFRPNGRQVHVLRLKVRGQPRQAVRLSDATYVACFGYYANESHVVCRLNSRGYIVGRCYGGPPGNGTRRLNVPSRMILTSDRKSILVADLKNSRIIKLSTDLTRSTVVLNSTDGVQSPYRLALDEGRGLLYVAENEMSAGGLAVAGRVDVYKFES